MSKIDNLMQRIREIGKQKEQERVLISGKYETLTSTQACRFQELQDVGPDARPAPVAPLRDQPRYALAEAGARLSATPEQLLALAASGKIRCFVSTAGLRGRWRESQPSGQSPKPQYLAVPKDACNDIAAYGSVNVAVLEYDRPDGPSATFELQEKLWVDQARVVLMHPLPSTVWKPSHKPS